jgi:tetratricopeptide (TPR) repeat protein
MRYIADRIPYGGRAATAGSGCAAPTCGSTPAAAARDGSGWTVGNRSAEALHRSGLDALTHGDYPTAVDQLTRAVDSCPEKPDWLNHLGVALSATGRHGEAAAALRRALSAAPGNPAILGNLGLALRGCGSHAKAVDCFMEAIRRTPRDADPHFNLGSLFADMGRLSEAEHHLRQALRLRPDFGKAFNNLGNVLRAAGRIGEAVENFQHAVRTMPDSIGAMNNLGNALRAAGRFSEAEHMYRRALTVRPDSAESWCNIGNVQRDARRYEEALASYARALELNPDFADVRFNRAWVYLLKGLFEIGWEEYEWRLQRPAWKAGCAGRLCLSSWDGRPFKDRCLLVYDEQGLGDTIQFARYIPMAKALGGTLVFETRDGLLPLFGSLRGVDRLVARQSRYRPAVQADVYAPLLSLPRLFRTRPDTIPWDGPYLQADPAAARRWRHRFKNASYRIGVAWSGSNVDPLRACPSTLFEAIARFPGVALYGLQKEGLPSDPGSDPIGIVHLGPSLADFGETAAAVSHLDLVISVDTAVAHLAGAMGKPTWVLLPYTADWRWLEDRPDSPWYPSMRLFRQRTWGEWGAVMRDVAAALDRLLSATPEACEVRR